MRRLSLIVLSVLVVAGCGTATVTTTQPLTGDRPRPDRVIVQDFGVNAPADERRDGQAVAKALTDTLITTLNDHGIDAFHTSATPLPGPRTASILGEVVYVPGGQEIRARIQVYQGAGSNTRLIAEMEVNTREASSPARTRGVRPTRGGSHRRVLSPSGMGLAVTGADLPHAHLALRQRNLESGLTQRSVQGTASSLWVCAQRSKRSVQTRTSKRRALSPNPRKNAAGAGSARTSGCARATSSRISSIFSGGVP